MAPPTPRFRPGRRRQVGVLSIALGVGILAFAFLEPDGTPVRDLTPSAPPSSTAPTVLGVTVEPPSTLPTAGAASPVTFELDDASTTTRPRATSSTRPPARTTTTEGPVLIPPTVVTNTTTTETTTETTTTTEASTTTSPTSETTGTSESTGGTDGG